MTYRQVRIANVEVAAQAGYSLYDGRNKEGYAVARASRCMITKQLPTDILVRETKYFSLGTSSPYYGMSPTS